MEGWEFSLQEDSQSSMSPVNPESHYLGQSQPNAPAVIRP